MNRYNSPCQQLKSAPLAAALLALSGKLEHAYRMRKERRGALDFDDLQIKTRDLLRNEASVREDCRRRFPVVMVDEFQDTNPLQKELLELLCGEEQRLFIVGDPKQSIYLFRGADVSVFGRAQTETAATRGAEPLLPGIVPLPGGDHRVRQPTVQRGNGARGPGNTPL